MPATLEETMTMIDGIGTAVPAEEGSDTAPADERPPIILDAALSLSPNRARASDDPAIARAPASTRRPSCTLPSKQILLASALRLPIDPPRLLDAIVGCVPGQEGDCYFARTRPYGGTRGTPAPDRAATRSACRARTPQRPWRPVQGRLPSPPLAELIGAPTRNCVPRSSRRRCWRLALVRLIIGVEQGRRERGSQDSLAPGSSSTNLQKATSQAGRHSCVAPGFASVPSVPRSAFCLSETFRRSGLSGGERAGDGPSAARGLS